MLGETCWWERAKRRSNVSLLQNHSIRDDASFQIAGAVRHVRNKFLVGASFRAREKSVEAPIGGP